MRLLRFILVLPIAAAAGKADAGYCDTDSARTQVADVEAFASGKTKKMPELWVLCLEQEITGNAKLTARFLAACEKAVTVEPKNPQCVSWSIDLGATKLGTFDLFDAAAKQFPLEPFGDSTGIRLLAKLGDPRGVPLAKDAWLKGEQDKRTKSQKSNDKYLWSVWRHAAIKLFTSASTAADVEFLTDARLRTKDASVRRALAKAIVAARARP